MNKLIKQQDIEAADRRLDFTSGQKSSLESKHVPHGLPGLTDTSACVLHHADFLSAYSGDIYMPLWSAFTLTSEQVRCNIWIDLYLDLDV